MSLIIALVTACGGASSTLPAGATVLADSAKAMRTVKTTHFAVDVQGNSPQIQVKSAKGQLTREGSAKGTVNVDFGRQLVELQIVIIGDRLYISGLPGSGVQQMPASFLNNYFDPRSMLDPDHGIAAVLASGKDASTEAREQVDGVDSYRVGVTFPAQPLTTLVPGLGLVPDKATDVWIAVQGSRLVKAEFPTASGSIIAHLSDYDTPAQITPPV
jgi:lipoprotein LprG